MRFLYMLLALVIGVGPLSAQHTFSIVAVDSVTGEIGSAGATCGDSIIWPGTPGAYIISDVLPGLGAIHSQAYWVAQNQQNAREQMTGGNSPEEIIAWLEENDVQSSPGSRQYGIVSYNGGSPLSAAYTGQFADSYKGHLIGPGYAIQGNILLGPQILDSMEARFLRQKGSLALKLMAAMQGANVVGADSRCTPEGTSSLSAFIRVAKPDDAADKLFLDINVAGTAKGIEPIDVLQDKFDKWHWTYVPEMVSEQWVAVFPNPAKDRLQVVSQRGNWASVEVFNSLGQRVAGSYVAGTEISFPTEKLATGLYSVHIRFPTSHTVQVQKVLVR